MPTPSLHTADGLALQLHRWPVATPRGRVQIVHGLGEHAGRYAHVAAALNAAGWDVVAHDHRGHGASGGPRAALAHDDDLLADLSQVVDHWRTTTPVPGPQVLLGHSMSGAIAARFVAEALSATPAPWSRPFDGLVLSSPALAVHAGWWQRLQVSIGRALAPGLATGNGLASAWVSRDLGTVRAYDADPLNHDRITPRLAGFILDAGQQVRAHAPRWRTPTLLMWAGADRCVHPAGCADFAQAAPKTLVTARPWPALYHELFNEPEREAVIAALGRWLNAQFPLGAALRAEARSQAAS